MLEERAPLSLVKRLVRSIIGATPGVLLAMGIHQFLDYSSTAAAVVGVFSALAGIGLAQPEVSAKNVAIGTVGTIAAYNAPRFLQDKILDSTMGNKTTSRNER